MGISMPCLRARPSAARVVSTPSATLPPRLSRISGSLRPWPSAWPTVRLRESEPVQVSTRSPTPREPASVSRRAAAGNGEARNFRDAAGDERGGGVVAKADAGGDAGGDGDYVFERAAQFDADDIGGCVEPQRLRREFLLDERGDLRIAEGDGDGGGLALCHFKGKAWAGECADGEQQTGGLEGFRDHLGHAQEGILFHALGGADDELAVVQMGALTRCSVGRRNSEGMTETRISAGDRRHVRGDGQIVRQWEAREKQRILAGGVDLSGLVIAVRPEVTSWPPRRESESAMAVPHAPAPRTTIRLMRSFLLLRCALRSGFRFRKAGGECSGGA